MSTTPRIAVNSTTPRPKFGLVAGWGRYPIVVAEALVEHGYDVVGIGIRGHADPVLARLCSEYTELGIAKLGAQLRFFRRHGVRDATLAGKIFKAKLLFARDRVWREWPDIQGLRVAVPHFLIRARDSKDDTLLGSFVDHYAKFGITMAPATDFAPELLIEAGTLTRRGPSSAERKDIVFGWRMAQEMGRLDIGQSVAIHEQAVVAVEAIEGTDECILRAGKLSPRGFTLVKTAKPQQDMRFDVPTVGVGTIETLHQAGGKVLAIEAGRTIVIDRDLFVAAAERYGIVVTALDPAQMRDIVQAA